MNIYLCGQKAFGAAVFKTLADIPQVAINGVSAPLHSSRRPDWPDKLRAASASAGIPVLPPGMLAAETLPPGTDLIVCAHSHDYIGRKTRLKAKYGAIGYHPSLLPVHRGRDAVQWAIKMRDRITGGTVYWLNDNVDAGPIAKQEPVAIPPEETPETLWREKLFPLGVRLLAETVHDIIAGKLIRIEQDEAAATWEPSIDRPPLRRPDLFLIGDGHRSISYTVEPQPHGDYTLQ